ncbi:hypothetical protein AB1Y20_022353 [Prymnesium parvum]|uniref:Plastid lipid-associated protein/fibrillin conserved domain-containing protein n=1 Tax=Prymnesium parvum TaxID=97485 RepID=A0AB34JGU3_PRYPA
MQILPAGALPAAQRLPPPTPSLPTALGPSAWRRAVLPPPSPLRMSERPLDRLLRDAVGGGSSPPNQRGARVVNLPSKKAARTFASRPARSAVLAAGLLTPFVLVNLLSAAPQPRRGKQRREELAFDYEGDAVTAPNLETSLLALMGEGGAAPNEAARYAAAERIVAQLEAQGGSQLFASKAPGKWCIPWVGGWDRVWLSDPASRFPGGPYQSKQLLSLDKEGLPALQSGATLFNLASARQFVYGPGEGGMVLEYLFSSPAAPSELLLTQLANIKNLGGNYFEVNFPAELVAYPATKDATGKDILANASPLRGSMSFGPRQESVTLQTTYLSATMWILSDEDGRRSVFSRTDTKSVADRRGLMVEGQVKEHPDEQTRYGKLLFSESLSDYAGWEANVENSAPSTNTKRALTN